MTAERRTPQEIAEEIARYGEHLLDTWQPALTAEIAAAIRAERSSGEPWPTRGNLLRGMADVLHFLREGIDSAAIAVLETYVEGKGHGYVPDTEPPIASGEQGGERCGKCGHLIVSHTALHGGCTAERWSGTCECERVYPDTPTPAGEAGGERIIVHRRPNDSLDHWTECRWSRKDYPQHWFNGEAEHAVAALTSDPERCHELLDTPAPAGEAERCAGACVCGWRCNRPVRMEGSRTLNLDGTAHSCADHDHQAGAGEQRWTLHQERPNARWWVCPYDPCPHNKPEPGYLTHTVVPLAALEAAERFREADQHLIDELSQQNAKLRDRVEGEKK